MPRRDPDREARLQAFAQRLNKLMLQKGWSGQELADAASKFVPNSHKDRYGQKFKLGRHLISAYGRAANQPTDAILGYIAKALGVEPNELLQPAPGEGEVPQYAQMTTTLTGKARIVVDAEVTPETALKIIQLVRQETTEGGNPSGNPKARRAVAA